MLTRKDIFRKLSDNCMSQGDALSAKVQNIVRNPTLQQWTDELPVIPDL
jgi:hypothetical protein